MHAVTSVSPVTTGQYATRSLWNAKWHMPCIHPRSLCASLNQVTGTSKDQDKEEENWLTTRQPILAIGGSEKGEIDKVRCQSRNSLQQCQGIKKMNIHSNATTASHNTNAKHPK